MIEYYQLALLNYCNFYRLLYFGWSTFCGFYWTNWDILFPPLSSSPLIVGFVAHYYCSLARSRNTDCRATCRDMVQFREEYFHYYKSNCNIYVQMSKENIIGVQHVYHSYTKEQVNTPNFGTSWHLTTTASFVRRHGI